MRYEKRKRTLTRRALEVGGFTYLCSTRRADTFRAIKQNIDRHMYVGEGNSKVTSSAEAETEAAAKV